MCQCVVLLKTKLSSAMCLIAVNICWDNVVKYLTDTIRYDTIRDAILTCARKPTWVSSVCSKKLKQFTEIIENTRLIVNKRKVNKLNDFSSILLDRWSAIGFVSAVFCYRSTGGIPAVNLTSTVVLRTVVHTKLRPRVVLRSVTSGEAMVCSRRGGGHSVQWGVP